MDLGIWRRAGGHAFPGTCAVPPPCCNMPAPRPATAVATRATVVIVRFMNDPEKKRWLARRLTRQYSACNRRKDARAKRRNHGKSKAVRATDGTSACILTGPLWYEYLLEA